MEQWPQDVVAVTVVVLVHNLLIQEHWYASLLRQCSGEGTLADLVGDVDTCPADPFGVDVFNAEEGAHETPGADLKRPVVLAAAVSGHGQAVGDDEETLLHATEAEAAEAAAGAGERRSRGVPRGRPSGVLHVGGRRTPGRLDAVRREGPRGSGLGGVGVHRVRREEMAAAVVPVPEHALDAGRGARAAAFAGKRRGGRHRRRVTPPCAVAAALAARGVRVHAPPRLPSRAPARSLVAAPPVDREARPPAATWEPEPSVPDPSFPWRLATAVAARSQWGTGSNREKERKRGWGRG